MTRFSLTALALAAASVLAARADGPAPLVHAQSDAVLPEALKKTIAYYSTLSSYSDTGTMIQEQPYAVVEARFTTYFRRASRDFYFDYQPLAETWVSTKNKVDLTKQRAVVWMFKGEMQKYQEDPPNLPVHDVISAEGGGQVRALNSLSYWSKGASIMIPSLLYSQAKLPSAVLQIQEAELAGVEEINKRRCHKITGVAWAYYPSGQRTGIRPVTVWIDVETNLIRRVFEDSPKGYGGGQSYLRYTFTFDSQANPVIDDSKFQFKVPMRN